MRLLLTLLCCTGFSTMCWSDHHEKENQYFELRQYRCKSNADAAKLDTYLTKALIPAIGRLGSGPVGVFKEAEEQAKPIRFVLIPHKSMNDVAALNGKLAKDEQYGQDAKEYLSTPHNEGPLERIRSELLFAFDCWPTVQVPELTKSNSDRIFELRVYESPTEGFGELKVEMFNAGEVPIFLDSGITPVFMGQAVVGDLMPSLTYMTVYPNEAAKGKAWQNFSKHPDWQVLKGVEKYKGTVSKIHKFDLLPVDGSQL